MFSHRFHRIHRIDWQRVSSHRIHGIHRIDWQRMSSHRIHRIHRIDLQRDILPQISQIYTDGACLEFCEFCVFCGTSHAPSESVKIRAICGRIVFYPPTERTGRDILPQNSQNSQNRLAEGILPQISQMVCVWSSVNSVNSVGPPTPPVIL